MINMHSNSPNAFGSCSLASSLSREIKNKGIVLWRKKCIQNTIKSRQGFIKKLNCKTIYSILNTYERINTCMHTYVMFDPNGALSQIWSFIATTLTIRPSITQDQTINGFVKHTTTIRFGTFSLSLYHSV